MGASTLNNKEQFQYLLLNREYDIFVSNGCPFIVPESILSHRNSNKYINIHPSPLPELRGADPVPGAILFNRLFGATCHEIDQSIDTGDIISRVQIENTDTEFVTEMYPRIFGKEEEVIKLAIERNFSPIETQSVDGTEAYYTFSKFDNFILPHDESITVARKFRAFDNWNKGLWLQVGPDIAERVVEIHFQGTNEILRSPAKLTSMQIFSHERALDDQRLIIKTSHNRDLK